MTKEEWQADRLAHAKALHEAWDTMADWWGKCKRCGARVQGTPKALREHTCEVKP